MEPPYRLGLVTTSRSGSTYFRRYLCNKYGLWDSTSWLKFNPYEKITEAPFANKHHILKILTHYIPEEKISNILREFDTVWLYRKDTLKQFLSHVARIRTQINLVYNEEEISSLNNSIEDNSLVALYREYLTFKKRLELFWDLYYTRKSGTLVEYDRFVSDPKEVGWEIMEDYNLEWIMWESMEPESHGWPNIKMPLKLSIDYEKKFKNIDEIKEWIDV
jgi:hypothetical protein